MTKDELEALRAEYLANKATLTDSHVDVARGQMIDVGVTMLDARLAAVIAGQPDPHPVVAPSAAP